jgi:hypothetical protein
MWLGGFQNKIGVRIFLDHTVHGTSLGCRAPVGVRRQLQTLTHQIDGFLLHIWISHENLSKSFFFIILPLAMRKIIVSDQHFCCDKHLATQHGGEIF